MFEIGYIIMRQYWGQGIASEAVRRIISYAKDALGLKVLYAKHAKHNPASGRILEK
jgi:ribosomal-protein-alanine N-acetyltransferase